MVKAIKSVGRQLFQLYRKLNPGSDHVRPLRALMFFKNYIRGNVLDAGCGNGRNLKMFLAHVNKVIGVDKDERYINCLRKRGIEAEVLDLDMFPYPFCDGQFDTVICTHVLEHLQQSTRTIAEFRRILKLGGHLILAIPNPECIYFDFYSHWQDHINKWSIEDMKKIISDHGFSLIMVGTNPPLSANQYWFRLFNSLPGIRSIWSDFWFICQAR